MCFIFLAMLSMNTSAQDRTVSGVVRSKLDFSLIPEYSIDLLELNNNNAVVQTKEISSKNASYSFDINIDRDYSLRVRKKGYIDEVVDIQPELEPKFNKYIITIGDDTSSFLMEGMVLDSDNSTLDSVLVRIYNTMTHLERVAYTDKYGMYSFRLRKGYDYKVKAKKAGYLYDDAEIIYCENKQEKNSRYCLKYWNDVAYFPIMKDNEEFVLTTLKIEPIDLKKTYKLDQIYYDLNKWNIRPDAATELNKLVKVLITNPEINIELSSHTDCRASDEYNDTLSQKRAESAVAYIVNNGIAPERITAKGYGEQQLVNKCADGVSCTESMHQANRRTEFRITSFVLWDSSTAVRE
ncbi:MAG: outer membrane protein OmpA-like peptidoglycan-associated protein [Bacteroidia bacterium]|jgi:outer membrane protein OmpA-like peptidoglycan-associated protein